jgi:hypothetical protein
MVQFIFSLAISTHIWKKIHQFTYPADRLSQKVFLF